MSHSLFAAFRLFAPLGRYLRSRQFRPSAPIASAPSRCQAQRHGALHPAAGSFLAKTPSTAPVVGRQRLPLRVVRIMEVGQASALAGRILMSGRMADVCAELDRMVEREAALQTTA